MMQKQSSFQTWSAALLLCVVVGIGFAVGIKKSSLAQQFVRRVYLAIPGTKPGEVAVAAGVYRHNQTQSWSTDWQFSAVGLDQSSVPLATVSITGTGVISHVQHSLDSTQVFASGSADVTVQGITLHPRGQVKASSAGLFATLSEPFWPTHGFYSMANGWVGWSWQEVGFPVAPADWSKIVTKLPWSDVQMVDENGQRLARISAEVTPEFIQSEWPAAAKLIEPTKLIVFVWFHPHDWRVVKVQVPFTLELPQSQLQLGGAWRSMIGEVVINFEPNGYHTIELPQAVAPAENFWERLEPPIESSESTKVLGVEFEQNGRPAEILPLTPYQIELLRQHGFVVDER